MAWEWVAPTATAVVALGGIAATWLTARGGRESQERLQDAQRDETRKLTMRDERRQAYADFVGEVREWRIRSNLQETVVTAKRDGHVIELIPMPQEHALVAFAQMLRFAAAIRLIGGHEVVTAVDRVSEALIGPFASILAARLSTEGDQNTLTKALDLAEKAMANELHLGDGALAASGGALTEPFSRANGPVPRPQTASDQAKH